MQSYRPTYHASVPSGWSNDPNGTIFYNGKAHLFFQHYPHKPEWGTMHWGHFITDDFIKWETLPLVLEPDQDYEVVCGCCSGSTIEKDGKLCLIESKKVVTLEYFVNCLVGCHVTQAIYLDMGAGWNYSWYRNAVGRVVTLFGLPVPWSHNWLIFTKR